MWPSCIIFLRRKLKRGNDESLCWSLCRIGHLLEEEMPGNFVPNSMAKISLLSSKIPGSEMLWNSCWQVGSSAWKIVRNVMPSLYLGISSASSKSHSGSVCRVVSKILELHIISCGIWCLSLSKGMQIESGLLLKCIGCLSQKMV